ncbi:MAG: hypothetical protein HDS87_02015 [Bacteroidales bacterium]|nr:hypothetical protein [Bacteroidales bacterium]
MAITALLSLSERAGVGNFAGILLSLHNHSGGDLSPLRSFICFVNKLAKTEVVKTEVEKPKVVKTEVVRLKVAKTAVVKAAVAITDVGNYAKRRGFHGSLCTI